MKTKLTIILLFVVNIVSAQMLTRGNEKLDTLCQTKFTAIYQYSINTSDAEGDTVNEEGVFLYRVKVGEEDFKVEKITNQIDYNRVAEAYMEMN